MSKTVPTQFGRALRQLGIEHIAAFKKRLEEKNIPDLRCRLLSRLLQLLPIASAAMQAGPALTRTPSLP